MADVPRSAGGAPTVASRGGRSFFQIYKKNQGYYTRAGTALGGGILLAGLFHFLWSNLTFDENTALGLWLKMGIPLIVTLALGLMLYWLVGVGRKSCDFMIATEGEMKKVNWTTRKEIISATKVVVLVTVLMAIMLFFVDFAFIEFFQWIDVLRSAAA